MGRLAGHAVVEPVPGSSGDASQPAAYRLLPPYSSGAAAAVQQQQQQRRSGRRGGGGGGSMQPKVARPGPNSSQVGAGSWCPTFELCGCSICAAELSVTWLPPFKPTHPPPLPPPVAQLSPPQHGYMMAGMMPFGYGPYAQQLVYYQPAAGMGGLGPYQQPPPMPAPGGQWPPHPSSGSSSGPRRQGAGAPNPAGPMQLGPGGGSGGSYPGMPSGPAQFGYYPGGPAAPHTPAVSGSHQRQSGMGRAGSGSSGGTGWGGVPLSQSAAEVLAGAVPSPRTTPAVRTPSGSLELPAATSLGVAASPEAGEAAGPSSATVVQAAAAAAAAGRPAMPSPQASAAEQPGEGESASQAGPSSSSSDAEEGGERQQRASSLAASSSSGGDGGKGGRNGSSSGGSSGGSRRSRGNRDRGQQPCAFFLKTGTCAYGDK